MRTERLELRLDEGLLDSIDQWRRSAPELLTRSEAARRLIAEGLSRSPGPQMFQLARLNVEVAASNSDQSMITKSYAFAWKHSLYPTQDEDELAAAFEPYFEIRKKQMSKFETYVDDRMMSREYITFYELEDHYDVRGGSTAWDRWKLIIACRYLFLRGLMNEEFWNTLLRPMQYPSEAAYICSRA